MQSTHTTVLLNEIQSSESALRPAPVNTPVFAGLGLHSARHGIDSLLRISLSSSVLPSRMHLQSQPVTALHLQFSLE